MGVEMFIGLLSVTTALVVVIIVNIVAWYLINRHISKLQRDVEYARGASQDFCMLTGDAERLLGRLSDVWVANPSAIEKILDEMYPNVIQRSTKHPSREKANMETLREKIATTTAFYSKFVRQTPIEEVGPIVRR